MSTSSQKGIAHVLLVLILLAGLAFGVYLVTQKTNLFSRASYVSSPLNPTAFAYSLYLNLGTANNKQQYVKVPPTVYQNSSANFTVEAWIRPDPPTTSIGYTQTYSIISKTKSSLNNDAYSLWLTAEPRANGVVYYNYQFRVTTGASSGITAYTSNGTVSDDQGHLISGFTVSADEFKTWRHVAGVVRNGNLYIYQNGKLVGKNEYGMTNFGLSSAPLEIGARLLADNAHDSYFYGEIDEVRLSNIARYTTNTTVQSVFSDDQNTLALYHLDGNFLDSSSYHNNGEFIAGIRSGINPPGGTIIFVNSAAGIQPSPTPTTAPQPTSTPPSTGGETCVARPGCACLPVVGEVCFGALPSVPTLTPIPTPTTVPTLRGCADSVGNGPNGIKCQNYLGTDATVCKSNVYPYLYATCTGGGLPQDGNCPIGFTRNVDNQTGQVTCLPGSGSTPEVTVTVSNPGCADSNGNGANGMVCTGYLRQDSTRCTNNVYPYLYQNCTGGPTPTTQSATSCGDSEGRGPNGVACTGYLRVDSSACPNNVYPYLYQSCQ